MDLGRDKIRYRDDSGGAIRGDGRSVEGAVVRRDNRRAMENIRHVAAVVQTERRGTVHAAAQVIVQVVVHVEARATVHAVVAVVVQVVARDVVQVMLWPLAGLGMQSSLAPAGAHHGQDANHALRNSNTA